MSHKSFNLYPAGCGKLTGVSNPITVRASGSRFGSWMTDTMIPSSDNRVSPSFSTYIPQSWTLDFFLRSHNNHVITVQDSWSLLGKRGHYFTQEILVWGLSSNWTIAFHDEMDQQLVLMVQSSITFPKDMLAKTYFTTVRIRFDRTLSWFGSFRCCRF